MSPADTPGWVICRERYARGWTQLQAAVRAGINPQHWSQLERDVCSPTITTMQRIARGLGMEFYYGFRKAGEKP